ncbi:TonB-dependent receptor [Pedobacter polaris]|uniref:TonB-dependent receptor n=1 Tax=Pedobacter polaris TaxID=2571273 RepID=A0A4U1CR05_9SPHI|nr:TonB-dependent receptor [Pedobacter polaris]TKC10114.1 TonB-dependent receptor [Pedobacter polaris]
MNLKFLQKISLSLLVMLLVSTSLFAQDRKVTGKVVDESGPIPGVNVSLKGIPSNVSTNADGVYTIQVKSDADVLVFSYIGFVRQQIVVGNRNKIDVTMISENNTLNEVVVNVGYGTKKRANVLGAVASIKAEDIEDLPVANLGAALQNRVAGLGVSIASGKPGANTSLQIRNPTLFGASGSLGLTSDPLFVIDGLTATKSDFDNLDASLVDNISFLKDASAAVYGAAGAKGVVLVTTKRGKPGKPRISYSSYFGTSTSTEKPNVLTAYEHAKMLNDGFELNNSPNNVRFSQADLDLLASKPNESWYDELWKSSHLMRHTINVSGGNDKVTFFAGGNYYDEDGNFGDVSIRKYGIRSGMDANITPELKASVSLNMDYATTDRNTLKNSGVDTEDLMTRALFLTPAWVPLKINGLPNNWANGPNPPGAWNPQALFDSGEYERNNNQGLSLNTSIEYRPKFISGLAAKVQFGKFNRFGNAKQYFPSYTVYNFVRGGQNGLLYTNVPTTSPTSTIANSNRLSMGTTFSGSYQLIGSLSYAKKIKKHDFDVLVLTEQIESSGDGYATYRDGQQIPGVDQFFAFNAATTTAQLDGAREAGKRSYLARLNYSYNDRYILEAVARYDGSANFPPDKRWGLFPSVGLGWRVSEEPFFKDNVKFVNSLKLRANVGLVGDDRVQSYQYLARFTQTTGMLFGTAVTNGLDPNLYPNPDITWEKAFTQNYGIDATFLDNKLNFAMDVWHRHTYDGFDNYTVTGLPYTVGISSGLKNYGIQNSWGTEFTVGYRDKINDNWGFSVDAIAGTSDNQLIQSYYSLSRLGLVTEYADAPIGKSSNKYTSSNYGYLAKGIIRTQAQVDAILANNPNYKIGGQKPQVGFMDFEDVNKDGVIDDNDITVMYENVATKINFGFTLGVSYKTFRLSTNVALAVGGRKFIDSEARKVPTTTQSAPSFWADHWTPTTPDAKYPRADAPLARENSTFWSVSGTVARVNNAQLSYSLPKKISEKYRIPEFRAYLIGTNLFNIYNPYDYKDPNTSSFANYPTLRTISLGLNISM